MIDSIFPRYILQEQIFIYACWSIVIFFLRKTEFISILDIPIIWLTRIVGIVYLLEVPVIVLSDWFSEDYIQYAFVNRFTGPYWFPAVFLLLVYWFSTQSLWFAYFQKARYWRLTFGLLVLLATFFSDIFTILNTWGYSFSSWTMQYQAPFLHIQSIAAFCLITGAGYFIIRKKCLGSS
ncbi:hypothetical protein HDC90_000002 [Pedobacter sp. AK013]|uniref:hypothetical protein n=1 Tax=Pedobacter sp. AK013 TaxID=2723071 RepID=UPI00161BE95F|nr:hypothetical protein [Pedobacter sp. AK013]MBB6235405.1 hypothetical protein [Pedobacter sp. AK013]